MRIYKILRILVLTLFTCTLVACSHSANTAKLKNSYSQQEVNTLFKKAEVLFDEDKPKEAYKILKQLAEQGDAKSQNSLGNGYEYGYWGEVDLAQAEFWYGKSSQQNNIIGIHNLGTILFLKNQHEKALPYFQKAASLNYPDSINMLGVYYSEGIVFKQDYNKALEYFHQAAKQNNRDAQFNIGQVYYYGEGKTQDYIMAYEWYIKSADQDYSLAQIQLAEMYFSGKGVEKDVAKAIEIIKPLAELGDEKAKSNLQWYLDHPN